MIGGLLKRKRLVICITVVLVLAIGIGTIAFILNFNNAPKVKTVLEVEKIKKYEDSDSTEELDDSNMNININQNRNNSNYGYNNGSSQWNTQKDKELIKADAETVVRTKYVKELPKGSNSEYYTVKPAVEHPGVVQMDAKYEIVVTDIYGDVVSKDFKLTVNSDKVKLKGNVLTVPYDVRCGYEQIKVTAVNTTNTGLSGTYTFNFAQFTESPTFEDDFDTLDLDKWGMHNNREISKLSIENGVLCQKVTMNSEGRDGAGISTYQKSQHGYGSYSVSMAAPKKGFVNCGIWLMGYGIYLPNPTNLADSEGEFDICELYPTPGLWGCTLHAYGYGEQHQESHSQFSLDTYDYTDFNTYSLVWTPVGAWWYLNGELVKAYSGDLVAPGSGKMSIILSCVCLADPSKETNNTWGVNFGKEDPNDYPVVTKYDWIKVYDLKY